MSAPRSILAAAFLAAATQLAAQQPPAAPRTAPVSAAAAAANAQRGGATPQAPAPAPAPAPAAARPVAAPQSPAQAPARPAAPPAARPGTPAAAAAARQAQHDSIADSTAAPIDYRREVYNYQGAARDPFASLLNEAASQTSINDLRLVSVLYDARGGRSVAVIRDRTNPHPYRVRRGESIGRLRVIQIRPYEVVFQVEEFGFERQEVLTLQRPEVNR